MFITDVFISGPFWICTTLVFTTAIAGNLANYMYVGSSGEYHWKYDFHKGKLFYTILYLIISQFLCCTLQIVVNLYTCIMDAQI